jgi:predicted O-methyltransferase YrrM
MTQLLHPLLEEYINTHSSPENQTLFNLNRETHLKALMPQMLSGQVQGKFLEFIARMIQPVRILEIGTYTGYSAICLARGLAEGGKITTIDVNAELTAMVEKYAEAEQLLHAFDIRIGQAMQIIPTLPGFFDLVFIDADKRNYCNYFDAVINKVKTGGWILADNVLWDGKVVNAEQDKDTKAIDAYNKKLKGDARVETVIVSLRDGISIARKIR